MKETKIFCDICGKAIDIEIDEDMAMFERIRTRTKISMQPNILLQQKVPPISGPNKELIKSSFDLCKECGSATEDFLVKRKEEIIKK